MTHNVKSSPGLASAIMGVFDPVHGQPENIKNTWALEHNKNQNAVYLVVQLEIPPTLIDSNNHSLKCTMDMKDVSELMTWLSINCKPSNSDSKK